MKTLVLAESQVQAYVWFGLANVDPRAYDLLDRLEQLLGRRGGDLVVLPGAERRPDYRDLYNVALRRGMNIRRELLL